MESIKLESGETIRGKQRLAVYNALQKPRTGAQILKVAHQTAPLMSYQDLRHIIRDFENKRIAKCLNPDCQTGRLYVLHTGNSSATISTEVIDLCAQISRAKTRLAVLAEVGRERWEQSKPLTATYVKKALRQTAPLGLNHVIAALQFLDTNQLIEVIAHTHKRDLKIYQITPLGHQVLNQIQGTEDTEIRD